MTGTGFPSMSSLMYMTRVRDMPPGTDEKLENMDGADTSCHRRMSPGCAHEAFLGVVKKGSAEKSGVAQVALSRASAAWKTAWQPASQAWLA